MNRLGNIAALKKWQECCQNAPMPEWPGDCQNCLVSWRAVWQTQEWAGVHCITANQSGNGQNDLGNVAATEEIVKRTSKCSSTKVAWQLPKWSSELENGLANAGMVQEVLCHWQTVRHLLKQSEKWSGGHQNVSVPKWPGMCKNASQWSVS